MKKLFIIATWIFSMAWFSSAFAGAYEDMLSAVNMKETETVSRLLQKGMDVNTSDPMGNTLLMLAARNGDLPTLEVLLRNKANALKINSYKDTALLLAAHRGHLQCVAALVDAGAEIDSSGWTPLIYAAFEGHADLVRFLLMRGANVNAQSETGMSALMAASRNNQIVIVRILLDRKADPGLFNQQNKTALDMAETSGNTEIAKLLKDSESLR
ncbi:MAG: ankyrin repeat domain-containing protein [Sterolibacterium sp.]